MIGKCTKIIATLHFHSFLIAYIVNIGRHVNKQKQEFELLKNDYCHFTCMHIFFYNFKLCYGMQFYWYAMRFKDNAMRFVWYTMSNWNVEFNYMVCYAIMLWDLNETPPYTEEFQAYIVFILVPRSQHIKINDRLFHRSTTLMANLLPHKPQ